MSEVQVFRKYCGKRRNCSWQEISPFPTVFSTCLENILPFSSKLKLSFANSFNLSFGKGLTKLYNMGLLRIEVILNTLPHSLMLTRSWKEHFRNITELEALERLYRSTGLIFLQWQKKFLTIIIQSLHFSSLKKKGMEKTCEKRRKKW